MYLATPLCIWFTICFNAAISCTSKYMVHCYCVIFPTHQVQARGSRSRVTALSYRPLPDSGGSRSAVALCRKVSKGTNVNPFTPQELHSLSRTHAEPTPLQPFQKPQGGRVSDCARKYVHACVALVWEWLNSRMICR